MKAVNAVVVFLISILVSVVAADAATINVGTSGNAAAWVVTGAGAVNAPAWQSPVDDIAITSNAHNDGTFAAGGALSQFTGFWYADLFFTLPANASSVSLAFSNFVCDDRSVLQLNGTSIADNGSLSIPAVTGSGKMTLPPGTSTVDYTFTGVTSATISSGFILNGQNDLRIIVNNTHNNSISAPTISFAGPGDETHAKLVGAITYNVPEPGSVSLLTIPAILLMRRRSRALRFKLHAPQSSTSAPESRMCPASSR